MTNSTEIIELCNKLQPLVMEFASQKDPSERQSYYNFADSVMVFSNKLEKEKTDFKDTLNSIKGNVRIESTNQHLSEYMKTLRNYYGELVIKTLKDCYDDSFEIKFFTDKIDDDIICTLEKYKDYEVYDVRYEQYCTFPPIDCRTIILDNRRKKPW